MKTIQISGNSPIDTDMRADALNTLNMLPTGALKRLQQLAKSKNAVSYLENTVKFEIIKKVLKI